MTTLSNPRTTGGLGARPVSKWLERLARFGFLTKGIVYLILGLLTASAALGQGGKVSGSKGAIVKVAEQPFGHWLLFALSAGLMAYAGWRFVSAIWDPERSGTGAQGVAKRCWYTLSGLVYGALAFAAFQLATGTGNGGSKSVWLAELMRSGSFGRVCAGFLGLFVIGVAGAQFKSAITASFSKQLKTGRMKSGSRRIVQQMGRVGLAARGVVLSVIGFVLVQAAYTYDPSEAVGAGGALRLLSGAGGLVLLGVVAVGLAVYGAYMVTASRYRAVPSR